MNTKPHIYIDNHINIRKRYTKTKFPIKGSNLQIREYSSSNKFILNQPLYRNYFDLNIEVYKKHSMVVYDNVNSPTSNIILYNSEIRTPRELASLQDNNNSITISSASEVLNTLSSLESKAQTLSEATTNKSYSKENFSLYNRMMFSLNSRNITRFISLYQSIFFLWFKWYI